MVSFRLFNFNFFFGCFTESILSEKEEGLNDEPEAGNRILDEANEKLWTALENKDLTAMSVARAMIQTTHKKIKSANTNKILNRKKIE